MARRTDFFLRESEGRSLAGSFRHPAGDSLQTLVAYGDWQALDSNAIFAHGDFWAERYWRCPRLFRAHSRQYTTLGKSSGLNTDSTSITTPHEEQRRSERIQSRPLRLLPAYREESTVKQSSSEMCLSLLPNGVVFFQHDPEILCAQ